MQKAKIHLFGKDAQDKLLEGGKVIHDAVTSTFGARSYNAAIERPWGVPSVVHDGVTVAKESLPLKDPFQNVGAEIIAEAAEKTNGVGDGTTATTLLAYNISKRAVELTRAGYRPMGIRVGIERAVADITEKLEEMAHPIDIKKGDVKRVATISAQNDEIGDLVAKAIEEVGEDGIVAVEESRTGDTNLEVKQGMEFDRGFKSPYFITDQKLGEASVTDAAVLVTDYRVAGGAEFVPVAERLAKAGIKNIVIIADDVDGDALAILVMNKIQGNLNSLAIQAPGFGDKKLEILQDIATVTGAQFISKSVGRTFDSIEPKDLGGAQRVVSTKDSTTIIGGQGAQEDVAMRVEALKETSKNPDLGDFDREKLNERVAKLASGVAVINVGARTEPELKERKERAIDAVSAVKAALTDGIVSGGGTALWLAANSVADNELEDRDEHAGYQLVIDACKQPFAKLMTNAGYKPDALERHIEVTDDDVNGIDVITGKVTGMFKAGIIDPLAVIRAALNNAASAATMIATIEVVIIEEKDGQPETQQY